MRQNSAYMQPEDHSIAIPLCKMQGVILKCKVKRILTSQQTHRLKLDTHRGLQLPRFDIWTWGAKSSLFRLFVHVSKSLHSKMGGLVQSFKGVFEGSFGWHLNLFLIFFFSFVSLLWFLAFQM